MFNKIRFNPDVHITTPKLALVLTISNIEQFITISHIMRTFTLLYLIYVNFIKQNCCIFGFSKENFIIYVMFNYTEHICSHQSEQENQMEHGLKIQFII